MRWFELQRDDHRAIGGDDNDDNHSIDSEPAERLLEVRRQRDG